MTTAEFKEKYMELVYDVGLPEALQILDKYAIGKSLKDHGGNATAAARKVKMLRTTFLARADRYLQGRMKQYRVEPAPIGRQSREIVSRYPELIQEDGSDE